MDDVLNNSSQNQTDQNQDDRVGQIAYTPSPDDQVNPIPYTASPEEVNYAEKVVSPEIPSTNEIFKKLENEPVLPKPSKDQIEQSVNTQNQDAPIITQQAPQIVDKTSNVEPIHHLETAKDALTKEADEEEEHFISEVEKHHGVS